MSTRGAAAPLLPLAVFLVGCSGACEPQPEIPADGIDQDCDGGDPSGAFRVLDRVEGSPDLGFGHAVAWWGDDLAVGAPLGDRPGVWVDGSRVVEGPKNAFTGSAVSVALVASPRDGLGVVLAPSGEVLWEGAGPTPGGSLPVQTERGIASVTGSGVVVGDVSLQAPERLVSLVAADFGAGEQLVGGLLDGGLWTEDGVLPGGREVGRGLVSCDLDADGDRDLAVGVPSANEVWLFLTDDMRDLDLERPTARLSTPAGRGGHALACAGQAIVVGAPQASGGAGWVGWYAAPLQLDVPVATHVGSRRESLGFALAVHTDGRLAAGAPGEGRVYVLSHH